VIHTILLEQYVDESVDVTGVEVLDDPAKHSSPANVNQPERPSVT
jgi:hypothetical protein